MAYIDDEEVVALRLEMMGMDAMMDAALNQAAALRVKYEALLAGPLRGARPSDMVRITRDDDWGKLNVGDMARWFNETVGVEPLVRDVRDKAKQPNLIPVVAVP